VAPTRQLFRSFTFRLALIYITLFGASVLILLGFIYWSTARYMVHQTDATIEAEIAGLAERYRIGGLAGLTGLITQRLSRKPGGLSVYLLANNDYRPLIGNLDRWPRTPAGPDGWLSFRLEQPGRDDGDVHRARARRFMLQGGFHLLVGRDMYELDKLQRLLVQALAWGLVITLALGLAGGSMMSRSIVRRIETINKTCHEIISGDLSRRIPTQNTGDDFDQLIDNLNNMLDQIASLLESVNRVSDNIAHDLRTPLTRLRNRLEMTKLQLTETGQSTQSLDHAVLEADELLATFNALLRIARIESKQRREGFTSIDLGLLVRDVGELYEPLAEEKQQSLEIQIHPVSRVQGDRNLLFQAIANLLDNAIKYTPTYGTVRIFVVEDDPVIRVVIADSGPGIPEEAREKVFQRFFRLDTSRATPGSGLGLSLVAAVAKLHGVAISLDDNKPGLRITLEFPNRERLNAIYTNSIKVCILNGIHDKVKAGERGDASSSQFP
jgi:signal transduction histidine kinase